MGFEWQLLWQAPAVKSSSDPFAFGNWDYGSSDIEWISSKELISAQPQSDVRPTVYKRFLWKGSGYEPAGNGLLLQSEDDFVWSKPFEWDGVKPLTWVISLSKGSVISAKGDQYLNGTAQLERTPSGFRVTRWLKKLSSN